MHKKNFKHHSVSELFPLLDCLSTTSASSSSSSSVAASNANSNENPNTQQQQQQQKAERDGAMMMNDMEHKTTSAQQSWIPEVLDHVTHELKRCKAPAPPTTPHDDDDEREHNNSSSTSKSRSHHSSSSTSNKSTRKKSSSSSLIKSNKQQQSNTTTATGGGALEALGGGKGHVDDLNNEQFLEGIKFALSEQRKHHDAQMNQLRSYLTQARSDVVSGLDFKVAKEARLTNLWQQLQASAPPVRGPVPKLAVEDRSKAIQKIKELFEHLFEKEQRLRAERCVKEKTIRASYKKKYAKELAAIQEAEHNTHSHRSALNDDKKNQYHLDEHDDDRHDVMSVATTQPHHGGERAGEQSGGKRGKSVAFAETIPSLELRESSESAVNCHQQTHSVHKGLSQSKGRKSSSRSSAMKMEKAKSAVGEWLNDAEQPPTVLHV